MTAPDRDGRAGDLREAVMAALEQIERQSRTCKFDHSSGLRALLDEHPATPAETARECRFPCDCAQFPDEHCACMDGHEWPEPAEVVVEEREALAAIILAADNCMVEGEARSLAHATLASDWLRDHDAALIAKAKAEAWDEGYDVGYDDRLFEDRGMSTDSDAHEYPHANPYRADRSER